MGVLNGQGIIVILLVGLIAGWLAGKIVRGFGFGLLWNIVIGIIGAFVGTWLWGVLKLPLIGNFWVGAIVTATLGAVALLVVIGLVRRVA